MMKLGVVFILTLLFFENRALQQLCSVRKSENVCVCKRITDETQSSIVTEADCSRINLQNFPSPDQLTYDLNLLDLSHNELQKLDENESEFSSETLEFLLLSYNNISYISDGFFYKMPNLRKLILSHNNITSLDNDITFAKSSKLTHLDLSFNQIKTLSGNIFLPLAKLNVLDLSYNNWTLGERLTQTSNSLTTDLGLNPNISVLNMDNLGLKDLHNLYFSNYTNLKHLSLADNHFQEVPRVPYSVQYLDLSGSDITVLQAKYLSYYSLKTLKLERMKKLESIHPYAFYNLQALEELSVRNCHKLTEFNELVFGALHKNMVVALKRLSLSGNSLQGLNSTYKYLFRNMDFIDLRNNPWTCNCDLLWLQEFDNLYKSENIKCSSPNRVSSKNLIDITDKDLPSCYPQKYGKKSHRILITMLALLVIILSALVGYLIYYTPSWYNRSRRLGPQSPYNAVELNE